MGKSLRAIPPLKISLLLLFCSIFEQIRLAGSDFRRRKKRARSRICAGFRAAGHGVSCFLAGAVVSAICNEISANHLILLPSLRGFFGRLFNLIFKKPSQNTCFPTSRTRTHEGRLAMRKSESTYCSTGRNSRSEVNPTSAAHARSCGCLCYLVPSFSFSATPDNAKKRKTPSRMVCGASRSQKGQNT